MIVDNHYENIAAHLQQAGVQRPLIVCSKSARKLFIGDYLAALNNALFFDAFTPNPQYDDVMAGVEFFRVHQCDGLISVGGGSAIDVAKGIKLFCQMDPGVFCLEQPLTDTGVFHLAIPTTAGTGSEANRFAVMYHQGVKQSVAHDSLVPQVAILEPRLLETLPLYQKKATLMDALCQAIESIWSVHSTAQSMQYAEQAISLILANWRSYLQGDPAVMADILLASHLSGRAIHITRTTAPHAMSYKLTTLFGIAHGHAVALCLQGVWAYMAVHTDGCCDPRGQAALKTAFSKLTHLFGTRTIEQACEQFAALYRVFKLPTPDVTPEQLAMLVKSVDATRLSNHPIALSTEAIETIYRAVLHVADPEPTSDDGTLTVRELQKIELSILDDIDRVCRQHHIPYYLGEGSLLGAIRHQGFIPWDDDMDLLMMRDDYERFLQVAPNALGDTYEVQHATTVDRYWSPFIKVRLLDNTRFSQEHIAHLTDHNGPYIDVFPIDTVPQSWSFGQRVQSWAVQLLRGTLTSKLKCRRNYNKYAPVCDVLCHITPIKALHRWLDRTFRWYNQPDNPYAVNLASYHDHRGQTVPITWYGKPRYVPFEGRMSPIPAKAEQILEQVYGDYMTLPPEYEQVIKHHFENESTPEA